MWPSSLTLAGGAGGAAGGSSGTANNGLSLPMSTPFDFDSSGWVVNFDSPGAKTTATGNTGANQTTQTANPTASSSGSGIATGMASGLSALGGSNMAPLLIGAIGLYLVLSHKL
jgi:hypothetical protein